MATVKAIGTLLSDVEPEELVWLWGNWIPLKCVTWFVGMPAQGKSTILADLAARVTRDDVMPDGSLCGAPGGVVLIGMEEMIAETVVPRMIAAGADRTRIVDLSHVERDASPGESVLDKFDVTKDLGLLRAAVKRVNATLVTIDPFLAAASAKTHLWANQVASDVFMKIQAFAEEMGVAVVIINHFTKHNKNGLTGVELLECMQGGSTLGQRARAAFYLGRDASDPTCKVLMNIKHSLAGDVPQITLRHDGKHVTYMTGVTPTQEAANEAHVASEAKRNILRILKALPHKAFTPQEVMHALGGGVKYDTVKSLLRRMTDNGLIEKTSRGFYQHLAPKNGRKAVKKP